LQQRITAGSPWFLARLFDGIPAHEAQTERTSHENVRRRRCFDYARIRSLERHGSRGSDTIPAAGRETLDRMLRSLAVVALAVLMCCAEASGAQLTLSWTDNSSGVAAFSVERRLGSGTIFAAIGNVPPGITSYSDASVAQGSTYCYRVLAYDASAVSSYSNEACGAPSITVTVSKAGTGTGSVSSTPTGINCGTTCSITYLAGTLVTLVATPDAGSVFSGWSGNGCAGTAPCTFAGNAPVAVIATFTRPAPPPSSPVGLSVTYNGKLRDRVGQTNTALVADGALDGALTATLNASGGRTITGLKLTGPGTWDTDASTASWALGVAPALDAVPLLNNPATMAVNFTVLDGGTFVLFASDSGGSAFVPGTTLTLTATFSDGTTATGTTTISATPPPSPVVLSLIYNGKVRDRVGQSNTSLVADGTLDETLTATLNASGGRTITGLKLTGPGTWDTNAGTGSWALGAAPALDAVPLLNNSATAAVNFTVPDGGTFVLFASDSAGIAVLPGTTLTLTATFSDGTTATGTTTVEGLSMTYNGKLRDRVGQGNTALVADGALDGTLTATLNASGGRTITGLKLTGPGTWDTNAGTGSWALGAAPALDAVPLLNNPATMAVNFTVPNGGTFVLFASDSGGSAFVPGTTLTLTATFSDGTTLTAATRVP
jgi:hypothetical protein